MQVEMHLRIARQYGSLRGIIMPRLTTDMIDTPALSLRPRPEILAEIEIGTAMGARNRMPHQFRPGDHRCGINLDQVGPVVKSAHVRALLEQV